MIGYLSKINQRNCNLNSKNHLKGNPLRTKINIPNPNNSMNLKSNLTISQSSKRIMIKEMIMITIMIMIKMITITIRKIMVEIRINNSTKSNTLRRKELLSRINSKSSKIKKIRNTNIILIINTSQRKSAIHIKSSTTKSSMCRSKIILKKEVKTISKASNSQYNRAKKKIRYQIIQGKLTIKKNLIRKIHTKNMANLFTHRDNRDINNQKSSLVSSNKHISNHRPHNYICLSM